MKAIYQPKGKAGEYASYACNLYVGCSNNCDYCYCKKGVLAHAMGQDKPQLKKCFKDEPDAYVTFIKECSKLHDSLKEQGLFFTFTSDPCLPETFELFAACIGAAMRMDIPCTILTKCTKWIDTKQGEAILRYIHPELLNIGFTLTGRNDMEKGADTNESRILAMEKIHSLGIKTWASIEPIVDLDSSLDVIYRTTNFCDFYKIGLMSGKKNYTPKEVLAFTGDLDWYLPKGNYMLKDSVKTYIGKI